MACSTCCFAWGKMAIANNYVAKGCCKFLCHTDLCLLWKCHTGWIRLENGSVEEAGLKGEFPLSPPQLLCELIELPDSVPFCVLMMGFFLFVNWEEGCETCTALGPYPFFVVHGRSLGKSCRILLTKDMANRSLQGSVWSILPCLSHHFQDHCQFSMVKDVRTGGRHLCLSSQWLYPERGSSK